MRLLLAEGDKALGDHMARSLRTMGHAVDRFERSGDVGPLSSERYDLLLIDSLLSDGSGLEWIKDLRRHGVLTSILLITGADQLASKGLVAGANACLRKPFAARELLAKVSELTPKEVRSPIAPMQWGDAQLDFIRRWASRGGRHVNLTPREWNLVEALALQPDRIVPRGELELRVHGRSPLASNALEVHLSSIRRKLGREVIRTVRGVGYLFYSEEARRSRRRGLRRVATGAVRGNGS
jgi:two-component system OmpR family response regulator